MQTQTELAMIAVAAIALPLLLGLQPPAQPDNSVWRITKTEWTTADEKGFGDFIRSIAESGCTTTIECLNGSGNPYRSSDPRPYRLAADCAKFPYLLRAYYASKNGLPFSYVGGISGSDVADPRFSLNGNRAGSRREFVDHGGGISPTLALTEIASTVWSATYRIDAAVRSAVIPDFYSPKIQPYSIHEGTVIYDPNGHVVIIYDIAEDGRIRYLEANPDNAVSRSVFGPQFGQSPVRLGGGFKNFRPLKLVGARRTADGHYVGGNVVPVPDNEIPDASLEQYRGNIVDADGDGPDARFEYDGMALGFFEFVRASISRGKATFNPVYELKTSIRSICADLSSRQLFIETAIRAGIDKRPQPANAPGNIYQSDDPVWEAYSTPSRDAEIKNELALLHADVSRMAFMWQEGNAQIAFDGASLKDGLLEAYDEEAQNCSVTYTNSAGTEVMIGFDDLVNRLFALDFDPYHCVERRWGATSDAELATCTDDEIKTRWYAAEQRLRNQTERSYANRPPFTLNDLETHALGSGTDRPPPVDIRNLIENLGMGGLTEMRPVGY